MSIRILFSVTALLTASATAHGQQALSENDRVAFYCLGALQAATETLLQIYPSACPTGRERGCALMREAIATIEEERAQTRQHVTARIGERRQLRGQLLLAMRTGEVEQKRCLQWRIQNADFPAARREPGSCRRTDQCRDLGQLPG